MLFRHLRGFDFQPTPQLRDALGVGWRNSDAHHWYVGYIDGEQVGCVGLAFVATSSRSEIRFGPEWLMPEYRSGDLHAAQLSMRARLAACPARKRWAVAKWTPVRCLEHPLAWDEEFPASIRHAARSPAAPTAIFVCRRPSRRHQVNKCPDRSTCRGGACPGSERVAAQPLAHPRPRVPGHRWASACTVRRALQEQLCRPPQEQMSALGRKQSRGKGWMTAIF